MTEVNKSAIVLLSGGLDSTTVLAMAKQQGYQLYALSFQYGQRHTVELDAAMSLAKHYGVGSMSYEQKYSTAAPTQTHIRSFAIAKEEYLPIKVEIENLMKEDIKKLEDELKAIGAPYTPGRIIPEQ